MDSLNISNKEKIKQKKSKINFEKLKSNYILKRIFNNLKKNKLLEIAKYNKELQKRLNLNINEYKEYSQLYSSIEIELKVIDNEYYKFINILDEGKENYHIYFNNSKDR